MVRVGVCRQYSKRAAACCNPGATLTRTHFTELSFAETRADAAETQRDDVLSENEQLRAEVERLRAELDRSQS